MTIEIPNFPQQIRKIVQTWVISRVFQKSGASGGATTSGGGSKKTHLSSAITLYPESSSPSSVSLSPLLDFLPYVAIVGNGSFVNLTDREKCSYDNPISSEHMSCFSTIATVATAAYAAATSFNLAPSPQHIAAVDPYSCYPKNVGVSAFPSLRSLQENLQLPFFFSQAALQPPALHGGSANLGGCSSAGYLCERANIQA